MLIGSQIQILRINIKNMAASVLTRLHKLKTVTETIPKTKKDTKTEKK